MQYDYKIVRYDIYCNKCEYKKTNEAFEPCYECLNNPVNLHSRKPVNFKVREFRKRKGYIFKQIKRYTFGKIAGK